MYTLLTERVTPARSGAKILALTLFFAGFLAFSLNPQTAAAQASTGFTTPDLPFQANIKPEMDIPFVDSPVVMDGELDDAIWDNAAVATNFSESNPTERGEPEIGMKALMAYDAEYLYAPPAIS